MPNISSAFANDQGEILIFFDGPLDTTVKVPLSSFSFNFGKYSIASSEYVRNVEIKIVLSPKPQSLDGIFFDYSPPIDLTTALRGPVIDVGDLTSLKREAVPPVNKLIVDNGVVDSQFVIDNDILSGPDPSTKDFILIYGRREAIQLTNIDNPSATAVDQPRMERALKDACALIDSKVNQANLSCVRLVTSSRVRTACIVARFFLDTIRRRADVTADYERALKEIDDVCSSSKYHPETSSGILRTYAIPQMYNGQTRKGLEGWWTDSLKENNNGLSN